MTSGFRSNGTDLDSIFAVTHSGWTAASASGFQVSGSDLNTRYAKLSYGSAAGTTGYRTNGVDINTLFAAAGTTSLIMNTQPSDVSGSSGAGNPSGTVTSGTTTVSASRGNSAAYTYTWHIASGSGVSFTAGSSATTGVTGTVNAGSSNSGTMYCTISDGVTSVNSNTVNWSLTNTTPAILSFNGSFVSTHYINNPPATGYGYVQGTSGSCTPSSTDQGYPIISITCDSSNGGTSWSTALSVQTGTDLGRNILNIFTVNGHANTGSTGFYSFSSGVATWSWNSSSGTFSSGTYTATMT